MTTHVEFEDTTGFRYVTPREAVCLSADKDGADNRAKLAWDQSRSVLISPETAARLRRELLGEPEPEARRILPTPLTMSPPAHTRPGGTPAPVTTEPEFVPWKYAVLTANGLILDTWPLTCRAEAESDRVKCGGRVVEIYIRREDARP